MADLGESTPLPAGAQHRAGFMTLEAQRGLIAALQDVIAAAPFYQPTMPRWGTPLSVRMTNCGPLGWVTDKSGYRYQAHHPETGAPWPAMPQALLNLWTAVSDLTAPPEAALINWYGARARMGLHVDADEEERRAPVVSVSLGDAAWFRIGGARRKDPTQRVLLSSGDVFVLSGAARDLYHGIDRVLPGTGPAVIGEALADLQQSAAADAIGSGEGSAHSQGGGRLNITLRRVTPT